MNIRSLNASLNELRDEAFRIAREHGFQDASIGEDFMLMVTEISEAMEDHREGKLAHEMMYETKRIHEQGENYQIVETRLHRAQVSDEEIARGVPLRKPVGIPSEAADIIVRVLHFCGKHGINIQKAVEEKMAYNDARPYKHGKVL